MNFAEGLSRAYDTKWAYINTFSVNFIFGSSVQKKKIWSEDILRNINLNIKNISTPQYTNQPIEAYIGDQWRIHNGRNEMWRFTITFRDQNQLELYRNFIETYNMQKSDYFDSVKTEITVTKDADYQNEIDSLLYYFPDALIESVGSVQFSNETESEIAEFDVEFKCPNPTIY